MKKVLLLTVLMFTGCIVQVAPSPTDMHLKPVGRFITPDGNQVGRLYTTKIKNKTFFVSRIGGPYYIIGSEVPQELLESEKE